MHCRWTIPAYRECRRVTEIAYELGASFQAIEILSRNKSSERNSDLDY